MVAYEPFDDRETDWAALKRLGMTHVYVGSRGGALSIPKLERDKVHVTEVFHEDGVYLFELNGGP